MPTFGSLFSGIGGIDLGLERAGWECRWQVEIEPFCQRVLAKHWPDVPRYGDITTVDWSGVEPVDLIAGGFPCQPVSVAGKRLGQDDERWLWPEFARAVRALRPRLVLVENVPGLLARGMGDVLGDLAVSGYDARVFSLSAAEVGAPHLRKRVFIVADAESVSGELWPPASERPRRFTSGGPAADPIGAELRVERRRISGPGGQGPAVAGDDGAAQPLADADRSGREERRGAVAVASELRSPERGGQESPNALGSRRDGRTSDSGRESQRRAAAIQTSADPRWGEHWLIEPSVGRVVDGFPDRVAQLRALGNAVVPQVAEVIGCWLRELMP